MLSELHIRNYAIIESVDLIFDKHLNVIIGETGAGKSILMGALNLVLGDRADLQVLMEKDKKCVVEAHFEIKNLDLKAFFEENDLDYADISLIRREILPQGKSRAFVNDTPVTLNVLKELTTQLIDIHAQSENNLLENENFFIQLLDTISQNPFLKDYQTVYKDYLYTKKELSRYKDELAQFQKEYDFISFQYEELDQVILTREYWEEVNDELNILSNANHIIENVQTALNLLSENEINVDTQISEIYRLLSPIAEIHSELKNANQEIEEIQIKIRELTRIFNSLLNKIDADENRLNELAEYQSVVNRLMQKHQVKEIGELISIRKELKEKLDHFSLSNEHIQDLENRLEVLWRKMIDFAKKISSIRVKHSSQLSQSVTDILKNLGMPFGKVEIKVEYTEQPGFNGMDKVYLMFAPNKGSELQTLQHVGSGGEKSRLMLAIKSLAARETAMPTLIFDEIDTGISGEVALQTGELLKQISKQHQVISITHLPQVAAAGKQLYLVYKEHLEERSLTRIKSLDKEGAVQEIAKMLSGDQPTPAAIENARNLIN
ncbi:MAG: DNA repair protein RecN [Chitinophagales bacterium]|nr:DNA repair protein RecN [Chitinophagales bacterium]